MVDRKSRPIWAERIRPMSLNPGSVPILAQDLGMFKSGGVDLEVKEFLGSPGALAALRSGEADFAQLPALDGLRLVGQLGWPGKVFWVNRAKKTNSPAGFLMMAVPSIEKISDLKGKRFGVGAEGDYWTSIIATILRLNGLKREEIVWVKDLDPLQKADMLLEGKIDVILTSIQTYIAKLDGDPRVRVLAHGSDLARFRAGMPLGPAFVGVASDRILGEDRTSVKHVSIGLMKAARLFSDGPTAWVAAASKRRPDVPKERVRRLWEFFRGDWPVEGGLDLPDLGRMIKESSSADPSHPWKTPISDLVATEFDRAAIEELGPYPPPAND